MQFDNYSEETTAEPPDLQVKHRHQDHCHLKELVVIGFDGVSWQTGLVNQIMRSSLMLECVHLLDGHVVEDDQRELVGLEIIMCRRE